MNLFSEGIAIVLGAKKFFSSLLAVSIGLVAIALSAALCAIALPISQPIQAQTQNSQQQEIKKLLQQAVK